MGRDRSGGRWSDGRTRRPGELGLATRGVVARVRLLGEVERFLIRERSLGEITRGRLAGERELADALGRLADERDLADAFGRLADERDLEDALGRLADDRELEDLEAEDREPEDALEPLERELDDAFD